MSLLSVGGACQTCAPFHAMVKCSMSSPLTLSQYIRCRDAGHLLGPRVLGISCRCGAWPRALGSLGFCVWGQPVGVRPLGDHKNTNVARSWGDRLTSLFSTVDCSSTAVHSCSAAPPPFAAAMLPCTWLLTSFTPHWVPKMPPPLPADAKLPSTVATIGCSTSAVGSWSHV